jgi:hypothetical protein
VAVVVIAIVAVPVALAGGWSVPLAKVTYNETTGSLSHSNLQASVSVITAIEYYFSIRAGGMVRSSDSSNVSSSRALTNITISMKLITPSNQTIDLGKTNISGGVGTRSHTVYLSIDQGVRASGNYKLDIVVTATIKLLNIVTVQSGLEDDFETTFTIS